jgi:hypothetical protein
MFFVAGEPSSLHALPLEPPRVSPKANSMSCAEGHELMVKRLPLKIDAVCVLLLALFLVGLAGYSVVVRFLK